MDAAAALHPGRLRVLHTTTLPPGWLGKTHAMATAAELATSDFLLFTDADVLFRSDALRRTLALAVATSADHLVTMPTTLTHRWDEDVLLGFLQILGLWAIPLWQIPRHHSRAALGVGAFNMVRRSAYAAVGGFTALRLQVVEDLVLGRTLKHAGYRATIALGYGLVRLHWASGAPGIVRVMTKNAFAALSFRLSLVALTCAGLTLLYVTPWAGLCYSPARVPALLACAATLLLYRIMRPYSGLRVIGGLLTPFAAATMIYSLLRSTTVTLRQGGIVWRETFYVLTDLKRNAKSEVEVSSVWTGV